MGTYPEINFSRQTLKVIIMDYNFSTGIERSKHVKCNLNRVLILPGI